MSQDRKPTLQSMGAVGNGNGNGHHDEFDDDPAPLTESDALVDDDTPPGGMKLGEFLGLTPKGQLSYIHSTLHGILKKLIKQETERANREQVRKADYQRHENERDARVVGLTVQVEGLIDSMRQRDGKLLATNEKVFELLGELGNLTVDIEGLRDASATLKSIERQMGEVGGLLATKQKQFRDELREDWASFKFDLHQAVAAEVAEIKMNADKVPQIDRAVAGVMMEQARQAKEIGFVPFKYNARDSQQGTLTPEQIKAREENAAKGTGLWGAFATLEVGQAKLFAFIAVGGAAGVVLTAILSALFQKYLP